MNEKRKKLEICLMLVFMLMLHNVASKDDLNFISEDYTFGWQNHAFEPGDKSDMKTKYYWECK